MTATQLDILDAPTPEAAGPRPRCLACGRALWDPISVARKVGPECWGRTHPAPRALGEWPPGPDDPTLPLDLEDPVPDPMTDPKARTAGCWRPDAEDHCCGLRNPDGTWRVPGLAAEASLDSREAMAWNYAVVAAEESRNRALAAAELLRGLVGEALDLALSGMHPVPLPEPGFQMLTPPDPAVTQAWREGLAEIERIRREAGLT